MSASDSKYGTVRFQLLNPVSIENFEPKDAECEIWGKSYLKSEIIGPSVLTQCPWGVVISELAHAERPSTTLALTYLDGSTRETVVSFVSLHYGDENHSSQVASVTPLDSKSFSVVGTIDEKLVGGCHLHRAYDDLTPFAMIAGAQRRKEEAVQHAVSYYDEHGAVRTAYIESVAHEVYQADDGDCFMVYSTHNNGTFALLHMLGD